MLSWVASPGNQQTYSCRLSQLFTWNSRQTRNLSHLREVQCPESLARVSWHHFVGAIKLVLVAFSVFLDRLSPRKFQRSHNTYNSFQRQTTGLTSHPQCLRQKMVDELASFQPRTKRLKWKSDHVSAREQIGYHLNFLNLYLELQNRWQLLKVPLREY